MGKKAILFLIIGIVLGAALSAGGVYFMIQNGALADPNAQVEEEYDLTQGKRLTLEKVQVPLVATGSKQSYLQADFTIVFKNEEALAKANEIIPDIRDAIQGVFEVKTADELKTQPTGEGQISPREAMKGPVLEAIRNLYLLEEDKEAVVAVVISSFMVV